MIAIAKTSVAKTGQFEPRLGGLVDATDKVVGRLASELAMILMGKHRPTYTPHIDTGDFVVLVNAEKMNFTDQKWDEKEYSWYTGYPAAPLGNRRRGWRRRPETDPSRGRAADAAQEQARLEDAEEAEDLHRTMSIRISRSSRSRWN